MSETSLDADASDQGLAPVTIGLAELDPIADVEAKVTKNRSKVGSVRPSALLYTSGVGATVDLPHLSVPRSGPGIPRRPGHPAAQGALGARSARRVR